MSSLPLSVDFVQRSIDNVLASERSISAGESPDHKNVFLRQTKTRDDWNALLASSLRCSDPATRNETDDKVGDAEFSADRRTSFYFGIQAWSSEQAGERLVGFCTFYIAYSSWEGRMLYVDQISTERDGSLLLYHVMAQIAVETGCGRLTWKQKDRPEWSTATVNPEYLDELIFLSMDRLAMANFVGSASKPPSLNRNTRDGTEPKTEAPLSRYVEDTIRETLADQTSATVKLRLAGREDTDTIARLVQMLATYVKEPDAVKVTARDYSLDGFASTEPPLFYCILADVAAAASDEADDDDRATSASSTKTVAMGFFYFGHDLMGGPFLYLEDLFCDEAFRKKGIGTELMKGLSRISLALGCSRFVWMALHWNTRALSFYKKIGAAAKSDLKVTRYCGSELQSFARSSETNE